MNGYEAQSAYDDDFRARVEGRISAEEYVARLDRRIAERRAASLKPCSMWWALRDRSLGMNFDLFDERIRVYVESLPDADRAALTQAVEEHESGLDCSDGPTVCFASDARAMEAATYSCCGWEETEYVTPDGLHLIIGSCYGH